MLKVAVLGANGFIGSNIVKQLSPGCDVTPLTKDSCIEDVEFDIFINAAGNSKRFISESDSYHDFKKNVIEVFETITNFKFKSYVLISSTDSMAIRLSNYGIHKRIAEDILRLYSYNKGFSLHVIHCGSVIGKGMKKGILYDILSGKQIRFKRDSSFNFISVNEVCSYINNMISNGWYSLKNYNVVLASKDKIGFDELEKIMSIKLDNISSDAKLNEATYFDEGDYVWSNVKSGEAYVKEVLDEYKNDPSYLGTL